MLRKFLPLLFVFLFVVVLVQMLILMPEELELRNPTEFLQVDEWSQNLQQSMENLRLMESKGDRKTWDLNAVSAQSLRENETWVMVDVEARFYTEAEAIYQVRAGLAEYRRDNKRIRFSGDVRVDSSQDYSFATEEIEYRPDTESLIGNKPIRILALSSPDSKPAELRSNEVLVDLKKNTAQFLGGVRPQMQKLRQDELGISTENMIFSENGGKVIFPDQVEFVYADLVLRGERAVLQYDRSTQTLQQLDLEEDVRVQSVDKRALAGSLRLEFTEQKIILEKSPRLIQNEDELLGERIVFTEAGKKIQIEKAKALLNSSEGGGQVLDE